MDKTSLVDDDVEQGRRFVDALRTSGLPIAVAMWFRKTMSDRWSLGIASPDVQVHGPLSVIRLGEAVRRAQGTSSIARDDLFFFNTSGSFQETIARIPEQVGREPVIVESFSLNGMDVERAVVLWIDRSAVASQVPPVPMTGALRPTYAPTQTGSAVGQ